MGALTRLRLELEELSGDLEHASSVPDAQRQPEVTRAQTMLGEARDALSSAFLSRRAMVLARESIERAQVSVRDALAVSRVLRERSGALKTDAEEIRATAAQAREVSAEWPRRSRYLLDRDGADQASGTVTIDSGIPADHPAKVPIEVALACTLAAAGGEWRVWITVPSGATWWGMRIRGPSIEWVCTLQDADEQAPEAVAVRVQPLVRVARAEVLYRSALGRRGRLAPGESD